MVIMWMRIISYAPLLSALRILATAVPMGGVSVSTRCAMALMIAWMDRMRTTLLSVSTANVSL